MPNHPRDWISAAYCHTAGDAVARYRTMPRQYRHEIVHLALAAAASLISVIAVACSIR